MFIQYTATRQLVGSGSAEIETDTQAQERLQIEESEESVSMSGVGRESQLDRLDFEWQFTTIPVPEADLPRWREFAASVANGETFTIDIDGTQAAPVSVISASYVKGSYRENRFSKAYLTISFRILER